MDALSMAAASGLRARIESLDMLANNLANASTAGFKADREFYSNYFSPESLDGPADTLPAVAPVIEANWTDHAQGILTPTGKPLDLALSGKGFFAIDAPQGTLYTRNGNFLVSRDGFLVNQEGWKVRDRLGKPIRLDPAAAAEVDPSGVVRSQGQAVAQLVVFDFENPQQLRKAGSTYFSYQNADRPPVASQARVESGRLESANYQPAEAAVRLVSVMRQFEMLNRALTLGGEMNRHSVEDVASVRS